MNWELDLGMQKMARYAAYQERCRQELLRKLDQLGCPEESQDEIMEELARQGFWNEERFARSYVRGKFRQNGWGRIKIRQGLWSKGVESGLVDLAIQEEIDPLAYQERLEKEIRKKIGGKGLPEGYAAQQPLIRSMVPKGFEAGEIREVLENWDQ